MIQDWEWHRAPLERLQRCSQSLRAHPAIDWYFEASQVHLAIKIPKLNSKKILSLSLVSDVDTTTEFSPKFIDDVDWCADDEHVVDLYIKNERSVWRYKCRNRFPIGKVGTKLELRSVCYSNSVQLASIRKLTAEVCKPFPGSHRRQKVAVGACRPPPSVLRSKKRFLHRCDGHEDYD